MNDIFIAITLVVSLASVYSILSPFLNNNLVEAESQVLDHKKEIALVLLEELKELNDLRDSGNISVEDFNSQKSLLLKDAKNVV